jgi:hypothetical protein
MYIAMLIVSVVGLKWGQSPHFYFDALQCFRIRFEQQFQGVELG